MSISFQKRDRDYPGYTPNKKPVWRWVLRKPKGVYEADGYEFELYPISILAEAIDRSKQTIIKWEEAGRFPKPLFDIPSTHYVRGGETMKPRFYTNHQVMNLHNLWFCKYQGHKSMKEEWLKLFFADVHKIFFKREYIDRETKK